MSLKFRTVAIAAALLAGTSALALAQSTSQQPSSKDHERGMNAPQQSQKPSPARSTTGQASSEKGSQTGQSSSPSSTQSSPDQGRSSNTQAKPTERSSQSSPSKTETNKSAQEKSGTGSERNAQGTSSPSGRNAQSTSQNPTGSSRNQGTASQSGTNRSTTASAPTGERVNLTSEQKTQIRSQVIERGNAPRVSHVNFNVSVGVVVPTSVHLAPVPEVLVSIHPGWRSYRYFVYEEEIIIVDPRTHKIVEVIVLS